MRFHQHWTNILPTLDFCPCLNGWSETRRKEAEPNVQCILKGWWWRWRLHLPQYSSVFSTVVPWIGDRRGGAWSPDSKKAQVMLCDVSLLSLYFLQKTCTLCQLQSLNWSSVWVTCGVDLSRVQRLLEKIPGTLWLAVIRGWRKEVNGLIT